MEAEGEEKRGESAGRPDSELERFGQDQDAPERAAAGARAWEISNYERGTDFGRNDRQRNDEGWNKGGGQPK